MKMKGESIMQENYDFSNGVVKNYSDKFSREEKLKAFIECIIAVEKISKEELKKEVDALLV